MIVNVSSKDIKYALFQHVRRLLFIPLSLPAFLQSDQHLFIGIMANILWAGKQATMKQASGRQLHFSLSSWRAQVMYRCFPN